jgi:hypothetical protein
MQNSRVFFMGPPGEKPELPEGGYRLFWRFAARCPFAVFAAASSFV